MIPAAKMSIGWLAYGSDVTGQDEVYVRPYPGTGRDVSVSGQSDGGSPAWSRHGIFFVSPTGTAGRLRMMAGDFVPVSPPRSARTLFEFRPLELQLYTFPVRAFEATPDGQRFCVVHYQTPPDLPKVTHINLIPNWFEESKAKAPTEC